MTQLLEKIQLKKQEYEQEILEYVKKVNSYNIEDCALEVRGLQSRIFLLEEVEFLIETGMWEEEYHKENPYIPNN
jgi:uncharacterized protein YeeX (DUF496 family)